MTTHTSKAYGGDVNNVLEVFAMATPSEKEEGMRWYEGAANEARRISYLTHCKVSWIAVAGVIAALSPNVRWEQNLKAAEKLVVAFYNGGIDEARATKVVAYNSSKERALRILSGDFTTWDSILTGPKIREFFYCITDYCKLPNGNWEVCIDGHAYNVWAKKRVPMTSVPNLRGRIRDEIKAAYIKAAATLGLAPKQVQAICWVVWRNRPELGAA